MAADPELAGTPVTIRTPTSIRATPWPTSGPPTGNTTTYLASEVGPDGVVLSVEPDTRRLLEHLHAAQPPAA